MRDWTGRGACLGLVAACQRSLRVNDVRPTWAGVDRVMPLALLASLLVLRYAIYTAAARPFGGLVTALCRWDCAWYAYVAAEGYELDPLPGAEDQANWAFFPAFPALTRIVIGLTGASPVAAGVALNLALLGVFVVLAILWFERSWPQEAGSAGRAGLVVFLLVWPAGFYLSAPLTEALFNTLLLATMLFLRSGLWLPAGLAAAGLSATRPNGVIVVVLASIALAIPPLLRLAAPHSIEDRSEVALALLRAAAFSALGGLGIAGFMIFLHLRVGDALAFVHVQVAWGHGLGDPFSTLLRGLRAADLANLAGDVTQTRSETFLSLAGLASFLVAGWLAWRRRWLEAAVLVATPMVPLSTGYPIGLIGLQRYVLTNPFLMLAIWDLVRRLPPTGRAAAMAALAAAQGWGLWMLYRGALVLV
ncbi:hypothetical protein [Roseomonas elaeocarpi]|uniref:DUF2029 domain-containing protein n=1 Tax=Roseomonas elaeocarpi TaxID=907779 RepID=A0ABV6JS73_9PROT